MHPNQRARHRRPGRSTKNSSSRLSFVGPARSQASLDPAIQPTPNRLNLLCNKCVGWSSLCTEQTRQAVETGGPAGRPAAGWLSWAELVPGSSPEPSHQSVPTSATSAPPTNYILTSTTPKWRPRLRTKKILFRLVQTRHFQKLSFKAWNRVAQHLRSWKKWLKVKKCLKNSWNQGKINKFWWILVVCDPLAAGLKSSPLFGLLSVSSVVDCFRQERSRFKPVPTLDTLNVVPVIAYR